MPDSEEADSGNFDLDRERFALEQKRFASDEHNKREDARLNAERLDLDAERLKLDQRFVNRYLTALILFAGTVLTIAVSFVQLRVNENNNVAALRLQREKHLRRYLGAKKCRRIVP